MKNNRDEEREKILAVFRDPFPLIVGGFSHEINNMLSVIAHTSELIFEEMGKSHLFSNETRKMLKGLIETSNLLSKIIKYLHSISKYFYSKDEPIRKTIINDLIKTVREKYPTKSKNFRWTSRGIKKIPVLNFPPQILYFIVAEVVENAFNVSKVHNRSILLTIEFQYLDHEKILKIIASDNGPGYPEKFIEYQHIQEKAKAGGLYIIIETIRRLNGWVSIGNKSRGGAKLLMAIPIQV